MFGINWGYELIVAWIVWFPMWLTAEFCVERYMLYLEYKLYIPQSNETLAKQLAELSKHLSKKQGYNRTAKSLAKVAKELAQEELEKLRTEERGAVA
jgi:hypothetical protein